MITDEDLRKHKIQWAENQVVLRKISDERAVFAAMAMQGCLSYSGRNPSTGNWQENSSPEAIARASVNFADALIAELAKEPSK